MNAQQESTATRHRAVGDWLKLASRNAKAAVRLAHVEDLQTHALYMTQQTMEAATKGLARGAGKSHDDVRDAGHDNLNLLALVVNEITIATESASFVDSVLSRYKINGKPYNVREQLRKMITLSGQPQKAGDQKQEARDFFEKMLVASPEDVKKLLDVLQSTDNVIDRVLNDDMLIKAATGTPFTLKLSPSNANIASIATSQLNAQVTRRVKNRNLTKDQRLYIRNATFKLLSSIVATKGDEQFRKEVEDAGGRFHFPKENLVKLHDVSKALTGLLIVGGLVWPHESYPRYPARPDTASLSFEEAAKGRQLGAGHYSDAVGVIKHIRGLADCAAHVTGLLEESYTSGRLFPNWN